jgi:hypothetical protein
LHKNLEWQNLDIIGTPTANAIVVRHPEPENDSSFRVKNDYGTTVSRTFLGRARG